MIFGEGGVVADGAAARGGIDLTPELRQVVRRMNGLPSWSAELMGSMEILLAADNTTARAKAFSRYCSDWRGTRHGGPQQPFTERVQHAVRRCAAQELAAAAGRPGPARDTRPNHDAALYALRFCARRKDGPLVAHVLLNAMESDPDLLPNGIVVAGELLESGARRSIVTRLVEVLRRIAKKPEGRSAGPGRGTSGTRQRLPTKGNHPPARRRARRSRP